MFTFSEFTVCKLERCIFIFHCQIRGGVSSFYVTQRGRLDADKANSRPALVTPTTDNFCHFLWANTERPTSDFCTE